MIKKITDDFNLQQIADSGQCFRWKKEDEAGKKYRVIAGRKVLHIEDLGDCNYEFSCSEKDYEGYWSHYMDFKLNYSDIRGRVSSEEDAFLFEATVYGNGIRILNQDPFEVLITFIISQRKSIPAIKTAVENLCTIAGDVICVEDGEELHAFPTPEQLSKLSKEELTSCGLGYRTEYVYQAADLIASGTIDLDSWKELSDEDLWNEIEKLYGVGPKVAQCAMLFGFHRLNSFPRDVWINRVLEDKYNNNFPFDLYAPYNGVMQQYLFFYYRQKNR